MSTCLWFGNATSGQGKVRQIDRPTDRPTPNMRGGFCFDAERTWDVDAFVVVVNIAMHIKRLVLRVYLFAS